MIKRISPSLWLAGITVFWGMSLDLFFDQRRTDFVPGISTVGMGLVNNVQGLIACRVLLGFFEAGIVPGCIYLISMYYRRYEVQWRMSLFFSAAILAGAFSGLLAFAIAKMHDVGGLEAWRWYVTTSTPRSQPLILCYIGSLSSKGSLRLSSASSPSGGSPTGQRQQSSSTTMRDQDLSLVSPMTLVTPRWTISTKQPGRGY
jgi:MFS family permease